MTFQRLRFIDDQVDRILGKRRSLPPCGGGLGWGGEVPGSCIPPTPALPRKGGGSDACNEFWLLTNSVRTALSTGSLPGTQRAFRGVSRSGGGSSSGYALMRATRCA